MKNYLRTVLTAALLVSLCVMIIPAQAGFDGFMQSGKYTDGQFSDVGQSDWFAQYVEAAYNYDFVQGKDGGVFDPQGSLTLGEAVKLAVRLASIYNTGSADFVETGVFYDVYTKYALEAGILKSETDYTAKATRAQFAELIYNSLPPEALSEINMIPKNGICDVVSGANPYAQAVYTLYSAGILTGSDSYGTFYPQSNITRAESCAVMTRLADPSLRIKFTLPTSIPAEIIYQHTADAVFLLETFDEKGESIRIGSGFFIDETGLGVTNLHIFENAANAILTLSDGRSYPVCGFHAVNEDTNLVLIGIDYDEEPLKYLSFADSDDITTGSVIYALGNPYGLQGTLTSGIISNTVREVDGKSFFQFSAPISFGSGGGPIVNALGQVVGIASSSFNYGQRLNLAIPINLVSELEIGECVPLEDMLDKSIEAA